MCRRIVERGEERAGDDGSLGHDAVARHQGSPGPGVLDDRAQQQPVQGPAVGVVEGHEADEHAVGETGEHVHDGRDHRDVHQGAARGVDRGDDAGHAQRPPHQRRDVEVDLGEHPRRSALVDVEIRGLGGQRGGDLHAAGPGADDGDALAAGVVGVVPGVGPQDGSGEVLEALDADRVLRVDVAAHRTDEEAGGELWLVADGQSPQACGVVPLLAHHLGARPQSRIEVQPGAVSRRYPGSPGRARTGVTSPNWARRTAGTTGWGCPRRGRGSGCPARSRRRRHHARG